MIENPIVFISYSWDDEDHKEWVLNLANKLRSDGIDVILDRYHLQPGVNLSLFVEESLRKSNRIIIVLSKKYKDKAEKRIGGVGQEFSLINTELISNIRDNERVIPLLKSGNPKESIPDFLKQYIYVDFSHESAFQINYETLLRELYKEPAVKAPELGSKPNFSQTNTTAKSTGHVDKNEVDSANQNSEINPQETVRNLIGQAKIEKALQFLSKYSHDIDSDINNSVILLQGRFAALMKDKNLGLLRTDEINLRSNQINHAILSLLDEL